MRALYADTTGLSKQITLFMPGHGRLYDNMNSAYEELERISPAPQPELLEKLTKPSEQSFSSGMVDSSGAPDMLLNIAKRLARENANTMAFWPKIDLNEQGIFISPENVDQKYWQSLGNYYDAYNNIYKIAFVCLDGFLENIGFEKETANMPSFAYLILKNSKLGSQQKYMALDRVMQGKELM